MPELREFIAESRDAALLQAARHFGVPVEEIEAREPRGAISGLGARVLLLAWVRGGGSPALDQSEERRPARGRAEEGRRRRETGGREPGGRGRSRRGESEVRRPERAPRPERPRAERETRRESSAETQASGPPGPLASYLGGILERMGVRGAEVRESRDESEIVVIVRGAGVSGLLEKDARLAAALSHLVSRASKKHEEGIRIRVDLGEFGLGDLPELEPEEEELLARIRELAATVQRTGEPRETPDLDARQRWLAHNAIRDLEGVTSESAGEGAKKRVRILPR